MKLDDGANAAPALSGVLETAVYVDDLDKAERFYAGVLGLPKIFAEPGRLLVFRSHESILLVFNPQQTERDQIVINGGRIPLHGPETEFLRGLYRAAGGRFSVCRV